ncbi:MAG: Ldh family oxidoreductase [Pseudomonadales bacterium]|nr:Ldh family oxidoreductase [Pseudomonadales bacterium]
MSNKDIPGMNDKPAARGVSQSRSSFKLNELKPWGIAVYVAAGMREADATTVIDNQLWSDLRGVDTHGFQRVSWYVNWFKDGSTDPKARMQIVKETPAAVVGDGNHGLGQLVVTRFMEHLIEVAKSSGIVTGVIRNSNDWGCGANYPYHAAMAGFICYGATTSIPTLAPFGSRRRLFGNNPIVWTFPRRNAPPIVLDMAMTPVALGKVMRARSEGKEIPTEWGFLSSEGKPTVDPDEALKGIIPAIGGYKGIGLAASSNILAGILSGSAHTGDVSIGHRGQFFQLMDPGLFRDREAYFDDIEDMVLQIRAAGEEDALPGQQIYLPGEIEQQAMDVRRSEGAVSYPGSLVQALRNVGDKVGVPFDCTPLA